MKINECSFTLINIQAIFALKNRIYFISQASKVFYISDPLEPQWGIVVRMVPRHIFDDIKVDDNIGPCIQSIFLEPYLVLSKSQIHLLGAMVMSIL